MGETRNFVCIVCPRGCRLEVESLGGGLVEVRGNSCGRGEEYGRREVTDPRRTLTSTVRTEGSPRRRLSVRTTAAIPLGVLRDAALALDGVLARPPIRCGEVLVRDFLGLGADLIATDDL